MDDGAEKREQFIALYEDNLVALLGYARRRTDQPATAADVVAETFLTAWRRLDVVPAGDEARLWLYGVAHRVLANHHRMRVRRERLGRRLVDMLDREATMVADPAHPVGDAALVRDALARLPDEDRELLRLAVWEGLTSFQIAVVLAIKPATVRTRLHRARARLRQLLHDLGHEEAGEHPGQSVHEGHDERPLVSDHQELRGQR